MKKIALLILSLFIGFNLYSQNRLQSVRVSEKYSESNHSQSELNEFYFKIKPVENSTYKYHFRHQRDGQIVDIYSDNGTDFSGELINSITKLKRIKRKYGDFFKDDSYIFEKVKLNGESATKIGKLILSQKFYAIPTDTLIPGWKLNGLDCDKISYSFKIDNQFQFSEYICHRAQNDSIHFVPIIKAMYDSISQILDLQTQYSVFESKLEKGNRYSKNGLFMMYIMTDKESERWRKSQPQREYIQSIKDTVDTYLKSEIDKQKIQFDELNSSKEYILFFNKSGKLKKVLLSDYDKPKLSRGLDFYIKEKREIRKCKKLIKQIFKEIDLSSFNLKYEIYRTLRFGRENQVILGD